MFEEISFPEREYEAIQKYKVNNSQMAYPVQS